MTYFKRYFLHRLRSTTFRSIVLAVITAIVTFVGVSNTAHFQYDVTYRSSESGLAVSVYLALVILIVIPMLETAELKKQRSLDLLFAFPITKSQLAIAHYLSGLCQVIFLNAVSVFASVLAHMSKGFGGISFFVIPAVVCMLPVIICLYSVVVFLFSQGNTVGDGVVFTFGVPLAIYNTLWVIFKVLDNFDEAHIWLTRNFASYPKFCNFFEMLALPASPFDTLMRRGEFSFGLAWTPYVTVRYIIWAMIGIACVIGFVYYTKTFRAERAGDISDSVFGYKVLIPLFAMNAVLESWLSGVELFEDEVDIVLILVAMAIGYFIYRRSFRIRLADVATIAYVGVLWVVLMCVFGVQK